jgi:hypothetical protein
MNELIESLDLEAPPEPPHDVRVEIERKAFTRLNPDLFYHEDVYSALNKQVAQPAFEVLNVHPRKRLWNGSISDLHNLVSKVLPGPETESERLIREELERREAFEAQRIEDERIAAEAAAVAAAAAQAAADAAAASDPKNKKKGTTKDISRPITPAMAEEPKVNEGLQAVSIPEPVKIVTETPSMRRERLTNLYHSLMASLGTLTVAASKRPLEDSPLFNPIRSLLLDLIDLIPFAAGGAKEAEYHQRKPEAPNVIPQEVLMQGQLAWDIGIAKLISQAESAFNVARDTCAALIPLDAKKSSKPAPSACSPFQPSNAMIFSQ